MSYNVSSYLIPASISISPLVDVNKKVCNRHQRKLLVLWRLGVLATDYRECQNCDAGLAANQLHVVECLGLRLSCEEVLAMRNSAAQESKLSPVRKSTAGGLHHTKSKPQQTKRRGWKGWVEAPENYEEAAREFKVNTNLPVNRKTANSAIQHRQQVGRIHQQPIGVTGVTDVLSHDNITDRCPVGVRQVGLDDVSLRVGCQT
ncbi:hypothetical protein SeMB42_g07683 [Synchytrium endobioticum]|uniref:Uncharacterized protein n=1 Tax=Synchytrium endobioticum TaxID=286115 RepID=A0A507BXS1_9FUNG|nr:hypothetical protein SeMB42_g07683 [Synchytrium endobioticum]